jgi:hypothetical protein
MYPKDYRLNLWDLFIRMKGVKNQGFFNNNK